jgi:hypothetical protein
MSSHCRVKARGRHSAHQKFRNGRSKLDMVWAEFDMSSTKANLAVPQRIMAQMHSLGQDWRLAREQR